MRFSAYPFDLITYRPEGTVYFVTDTLTAVKRFVFLTLVTDTLIVLINTVFLSLVTDTLIALQTNDTKTFYTIRQKEPRFHNTRHGHTYRCKAIRFVSIVVVSFT